jgi:hypothetical protein
LILMMTPFVNGRFVRSGQALLYLLGDDMTWHAGISRITLFDGKNPSGTKAFLLHISISERLSEQTFITTYGVHKHFSIESASFLTATGLAKFVRG